MVYQFKPNLPFRPNVAAQTIGDVCEDLERSKSLTPENLVNVSRPEDAPLHAAFEWDDAVAGEEWRKQQARCLIGAVILVEEEKPPVRGFYKIEHRGSHYEALSTILKTPDKHEALLNTAKAELAAFSRKYRMLSELAPVVAAIDRFLK